MPQKPETPKTHQNTPSLGFLARLLNVLWEKDISWNLRGGFLSSWPGSPAHDLHGPRVAAEVVSSLLQPTKRVYQKQFWAFLNSTDVYFRKKGAWTNRRQPADKERATLTRELFHSPRTTVASTSSAFSVETKHSLQSTERSESDQFPPKEPITNRSISKKEKRRAM